MNHEVAIDSCVILTHAFDNQRFKHRVAKMLEDFRTIGINHVVTPSVADECTNRVAKVRAAIDNRLKSLRDALFKAKNGSQQNPDVYIDLGDAMKIRDFFIIAFKSADKKYPTEIELLEYVETFVIRSLESRIKKAKIRGSTQILLDSFMAECKSEIDRIFANTDAILSTYTASQTNSSLNKITPTSFQTKLSPFVKNQNDIRVLAELDEYHRNGGTDVLVSLDYKDIVQNSLQIQQTIGIRVTDPLYAVYF